MNEDNNLSKNSFKIVSLDNNLNRVRCNCNHFHFTGYSCRHSLAVLIKNSMHPRNLDIHERWILQKITSITNEIGNLLINVGDSLPKEVYCDG